MKEPKVFIIKHKESGKLYSTQSGKSSWGSTAAAKNAFCNSQSSFNNPVYFDKQTENELIELDTSSTEDRLIKAENLLKTASGLLDDYTNYYNDIKIFETINNIDSFLEGK